MSEHENDPLKKKQEEILNEASELIKRGKLLANKSGIIPLIEGPIGCEEDESYIALWMEVDEKGIPLLINMTLGNVTIHLPPCLLGGTAITINEAMAKIKEYMDKNLGDGPTL